MSASNDDGLELVLKDCLALWEHNEEYKKCDRGLLADIVKELLELLRDEGYWAKIHRRIGGTGVEAFVYYATDDKLNHLAIKVFTGLQIDLDSRFVGTLTEDETFDFGYVNLADIERCALDSMTDSGISCPALVRAFRRVLITSFIGTDGFPAPKLIDVDLSSRQLRECFKEMIKIMRDLYQKCGLVHCNLIETNTLYHKNKLYVIGASQALIKKHPHASPLLMKECDSVVNFFARAGLNITAKSLFNIVTDGSDRAFKSCSKLLECNQEEETLILKKPTKSNEVTVEVKCKNTSTGKNKRKKTNIHDNKFSESNIDYLENEDENLE